ncbi:MAG: hypothetical protein Q4G64_06075 [bacterium]|nr:hypothetical protein [bacterium]
MDERGIGQLIRLANAPGALLARMAALATVPFLVVAFFAMRNRETTFSWILFGVACVFAAAVAFFAWRRARLAALVDEAELRVAGQSTGAGELTRPEQESIENRVTGHLNRLQEFDEERRLRRDTWLPRVEATQRALVRAAGGVEKAPYLRDDLRVTLIALGLTVAAIPVGSLGTFLALLHLLG